MSVHKSMKTRICSELMHLYIVVKFQTALSGNEQYRMLRFERSPPQQHTQKQKAESLLLFRTKKSTCLVAQEMSTHRNVWVGVGVAVGAVALAATWWFLSSKKKQKLTLKSTVTLKSGYKMPRVGLGTWRSKPGEVISAVKAALLCGYRHIDTAWAYQNEAEVGEGIRQAIAESGGKLKRSDIFVTTKLWNQFHDPEDVEKACRDSLEKLGLEYVDLYLMHWPVAFKYIEGNVMSTVDGKSQVLDIPVKATWQAMEPLVAKGLVKSLGVSNFTVDQMHDLLTYAKVKPVTNQCEAHPHFPNSDVANFCKRNGMVFTAYSSLGTIWEGQASCQEDPVVKQLASKYGKSAAQILLRWGLQRDYLILPKSVSAKRILENSQLFDFEISDEDMKRLNALGQGKDRKLKPGWASQF
eukprot:TRINITY_DN46_c0_g1_i1.p2 TRINITY_DN46_c0_g1~~TRINITY_DN46_c0_g1_i1.p2  ORF type:complete len:411 (-),score=111.41 TRINITY_DN46_c0_g1_i1:370-1602(-)